ncbi:MAG: hypothetical protein ABF651_01425 [Sporolactobacillus sp.]
MKISYRIFDSPGYKKCPIIQFIDKKYIGLEELLNTDDSEISLEEILEKLVLVENGHSQFEEIGNERSMLEIRKENCTIYDSFEGIIDDEDLNPTINISLEQLKKIILNWKVEKERLFKML